MTQIKDMLELAKKLPEEEMNMANDILNEVMKMKGSRPESEISKNAISALATVLISKYAQRKNMKANMETLIAVVDKLEDRSDEAPPDVREAVMAALCALSDGLAQRDAANDTVDKFALQNLVNEVKEGNKGKDIEVAEVRRLADEYLTGDYMKIVDEHLSKEDGEMMHNDRAKAIISDLLTVYATTNKIEPTIEGLDSMLAMITPYRDKVSKEIRRAAAKVFLYTREMIRTRDAIETAPGVDQIVKSLMDMKKQHDENCVKCGDCGRPFKECPNCGDKLLPDETCDKVECLN